MKRRRSLFVRYVDFSPSYKVSKISVKMADAIYNVARACASRNYGSVDRDRYTYIVYWTLSIILYYNL